MDSIIWEEHKSVVVKKNKFDLKACIKFLIMKIEFPNILRHIQMSYGISQCPQVQNPEYPEYPESHENSISQYP